MPSRPGLVELAILGYRDIFAFLHRPGVDPECRCDTTRPARSVGVPVRKAAILVNFAKAAQWVMAYIDGQHWKMEVLACRDDCGDARGGLLAQFWGNAYCTV